METDVAEAQKRETALVLRQVRVIAIDGLLLINSSPNDLSC